MLNKLIRKKKIGGSHTEIRNLTKGIVGPHLTDKKGKRIVKEAIKELIRRRYVIIKPSTGELHVSINPNRIKEVFEFLNRNK